MPLLDQGVPQGKLSPHPVPVPPAVSLPQDVALFNELGQNPVGCSFSDAYRCSDVAHADARVVGHTYKDMGVVCQKIPAGH